MNYLLEMYNSRPVLAFFIAGASFAIACEMIYESYNFIFGNEIKPRPKKRRIVNRKIATQNSQNIKSRVVKKQGLEGRKPADVWNTVLFFPDFFPDQPDSATKQLYHYFESAKMSIHICMYLASHPGIGEVIRKKYAEGLLIQVVTDYDTFTAHNNCGVKHWKRTGIEVRMKATGFLMHHKFAVIDEEALLTGSLNWTKQGFSNNQENVMITTEPRIVRKYLEEFFTLWTLFAGEEDY